MSNVLCSEYLCNGETSEWCTTRAPGQTIDDLADVHDQEVAAAKLDCSDNAVTLPKLKSTWQSGDTTLTYASPESYGQAKHDADVDALKIRYPA